MPKTFALWARLLVVLSAGIGASGGLRTAHGYACAGEPLRIYPGFGVIPTNAELRVVFPHGAAELYTLGENRQVLRRGEITTQNPRFFLKSEKGETMALRATRQSGPLLATFVLQVPQPLQPGTSYELQAQDARMGSDFLLTQYKTSAGPDSAPPMLTTPVAPKSGRSPTPNGQLIQRVRYYHLSRAGYKEAYGPWLEFSISATDDGGAVYYEIRHNLPGTATLLAIGQPAGDQTLRLGSWAICRASDLEFPATGTLALLVSAVDGAGHVSAPASFTVDVSHPRRQRY